MTKQIEVMNNTIIAMVVQIVDTNNENDKGKTHADNDKNN